MALRGVVTSDWHLGGMKKVLKDPTEKQLIEINKVYSYAVENSIEHVFVPGDISDTPTLSEHDLIALVSLLLSYDDHVHTYYTLGNHDVASISKTSCDVLKVFADNGFFKRFHLFYQPEVRKIDGVYVAFMPYPHTKVPECARAPLVFAHIETAGAIGDNGRVLKTGHEDFQRQPGDFVFSGHIHQRQYLKSKRLVYGGSLYQKNFGEALPKSFVDFTAGYKDKKLMVKHEFIGTNPEFVLETKLIQSSDDWQNLTKESSTRYKILVGEGVVVPKNIMREFPNIIYLNGAHASTKVKMDGTVDTSGSLTLQDLPKFNLKTGLIKYLKSAELDKHQVSRAKSLVQEALDSLNIQ